MSKPSSGKDFVRNTDKTEGSIDADQHGITATDYQKTPTGIGRAQDVIVVNQGAAGSSVVQVLVEPSPGVSNDDFSVTLPEGTRQFIIRPDTITRWEYTYIINTNPFVKRSPGGALSRTLDKPIGAGGLEVHLKSERINIPFKIEVWS